MFHLPFPQVLEHWLIIGLQTYTGACLKRGDKPDFSTGRSCSIETILKTTSHFEIWARWSWFFLLYLSLILPTNGTNIYNAGHSIWWSDRLWTQALIYFSVLAIFWTHAWHNAFGFSWPAHRWTLSWLWHMPSVNPFEWLFTWIRR